MLTGERDRERPITLIPPGHSRQEYLYAEHSLDSVIECG